MLHATAASSDKLQTTYYIKANKQVGRALPSVYLRQQLLTPSNNSGGQVLPPEAAQRLIPSCAGFRRCAPVRRFYCLVRPSCLQSKASKEASFVQIVN